MPRPTPSVSPPAASPASAVGAEAFSATLEALRRECAVPAHGLFGPGSLSWRVNRECILLLGGGAAALLQLAHPFVAHAVAAHSVVTTDTARRFRRTFSRVLAMTFGDLGTALHAAERVRAVHDRVRGPLPEAAGPYAAGTIYTAHDREALCWVQATLLDTAIKVYSDLVEPLCASECEELHRGTLRLGLLFGLRPDEQPADYAAFRRYVDDAVQSERLTVTPAARELATQILRPPSPVAAPVFQAIRAYTAFLLPERLRAGFGLSYGLGDQLLVKTLRGSLRRVLPRLPPSVRYFPAYHDAERRLRGEPLPDRKSHAVARLWLKLLRPSPTLRGLHLGDLWAG